MACLQFYMLSFMQSKYVIGRTAGGIGQSWWNGTALAWTCKSGSLCDRSKSSVTLQAEKWLAKAFDKRLEPSAVALCINSPGQLILKSQRLKKFTSKLRNLGMIEGSIDEWCHEPHQQALCKTVPSSGYCLIPLESVPTPSM